MNTYFVRWEIDVEANSPMEAAQKVLEMHRDKDSIATIFVVEDMRNGERFWVDAGENSLEELKYGE